MCRSTTLRVPIASLTLAPSTHHIHPSHRISPPPHLRIISPSQIFISIPIPTPFSFFPFFFFFFFLPCMYLSYLSRTSFHHLRSKGTHVYTKDTCVFRSRAFRYMDTTFEGLRYKIAKIALQFLASTRGGVGVRASGSDLFLSCIMVGESIDTTACVVLSPSHLDYLCTIETHL